MYRLIYVSNLATVQDKYVLYRQNICKNMYRSRGYKTLFMLSSGETKFNLLTDVKNLLAFISRINYKLL